MFSSQVRIPPDILSPQIPVPSLKVLKRKDHFVVKILSGTGHAVKNVDV
jgi:hypothetical protein